jgi:hypothetical protein
MQNVIGRRWNRYPANGQVKILNERDQVKIMSFGRISQLSEGGLAFSTRQKLEIGEPVELEFELPMAKAAVKLAAIVRSNIGDIYGVEFLQPGMRQRQGLTFACNALAFHTEAA